MKKIVIFFLFVYLGELKANSSDSLYHYFEKEKTLFVELLGPARYFSINGLKSYPIKKNLGIRYKAGISFSKYDIDFLELRIPLRSTLVWQIDDYSFDFGPCLTYYHLSKQLGVDANIYQPNKFGFGIETNFSMVLKNNYFLGAGIYNNLLGESAFDTFLWPQFRVGYSW